MKIGAWRQHLSTTAAAAAAASPLEPDPESHEPDAGIENNGGDDNFYKLPLKLMELSINCLCSLVVLLVAQP